PFPVLVERLRLPRSRGMTPLFQSMFAYQSLPRANRSLLSLALDSAGTGWDFSEELAVETVAMPPFDAQFPLSLVLGRDDSGFRGRLQYDGSAVTAADALHLAGRFPELVSEFLGSLNRKTTIAVADCGERVEDLFDDAAHRAPHAIA